MFAFFGRKKATFSVICCVAFQISILHKINRTENSSCHTITYDRKYIQVCTINNVEQFAVIHSYQLGDNTINLTEFIDKHIK